MIRYPSTPENRVERSFAITPSDTVNFTFSASAIYCGSTGNIVVVNEDGSTTTYVGVPTGTTILCRAMRVNSTATTASSLVGIY